MKPRHFIQQINEADINSGQLNGQVVTRFPPEPNGYLHIGHAKSICLNFNIAKEFDGTCHLRFDDTNPIKEEDEFIKAIEHDVNWLGFDWKGHLYHTSDYYQQLFDYAIVLIDKGVAYVDSLSTEEMREYRGTLKKPGKNSPDRDRPIKESLELFQKMREGEFKDGEYVLRAKIDMSSGNINMRDPIIYRIRHVTHPRTGDKWCIYPMYDFAHSLSDAIEAITHSLCTLEFQDHRPLYDWFIEHCDKEHKPQQIEFSRLNLSHTITSKRKLKQLIDDGHVSGWDDPRMPTLIGMKRRGYPAVAIRNFCDIIGVTKSDSVIEMSVLEECVREELNQHAPRAMCVLNPLKIVIENYPEDKKEILNAKCHPQDESMGERQLPFSQEIYIDQDDFKEEPEGKYFRLAPGKEVRLRGAYVIKCTDMIKDANGKVTELRCSYDPDTLGKKPEGRKVKGVIHWVSSDAAQKATIQLYERLFNTEHPARSENISQDLNPHSLTIVNDCLIEPSLANAKVGDCFQFERVGYFCVDAITDEGLVFNRIVELRAAI